MITGAVLTAPHSTASSAKRTICTVPQVKATLLHKRKTQNQRKPPAMAEGREVAVLGLSRNVTSEHLTEILSSWGRVVSVKQKAR